MMVENKVENFAFYEQLQHYYQANRRKIRSRYNDLTKKFLAYNDREENPDAFLILPQFEALEMYIFIKEFLENAQFYEIFDDWRSRRNSFSDASYYSVRKEGQYSLFDFRKTADGSSVFLPEMVEKQTDLLFKQMEKYKEGYPNYIFALTMGLGKTILMATCIFYEFLLANKYPRDKRFCHNALVFAPDKTVLQSLREIITFDKTKVVPPEYAKVLDANIKIHFLDESGMTLHTLDDSEFNIIISNTQKIIVKKKLKDDKPIDLLFRSDSLLSSVYDEENNQDIQDDLALMENQRFKKICRLSQLGVYVDEAHHLFGSDLEKQIRASSSKKTSLRDTINMLAESTSIVACYNYTGTPYVNKQLLPEVVYAYGLKESIQNGFLKDADLKAFENVKSEEFLSFVVKSFWEKYSGRTYEELLPKLAIFATTIKEADEEVRPIVEKILAELGIPSSKILVNVGDEKITKNEDIRNFNDLDVPGTLGCEKQILILVGKGREGWNCRSLFSVAMFRSPQSKVFVLQATMRCLRKITSEQLTATVFLSRENFDILDDELNKNFNMDIVDMSNSGNKDRHRYKVRVVPPPRTISLKRIWREYVLTERKYINPIDFKLRDLDFSRYAAIMYEKDGITQELSLKEMNIDSIKVKVRFSLFSLVGEISRYINIPCILSERIIRESVDGEEAIIEAVNKYNEILDDVIIPLIFRTLFDTSVNIKTEDRQLVLLNEPKQAGYYEFSGNPALVVKNSDSQFTDTEIDKTFHADTYIFDSKPELECFLQYIKSKKVKKVYFTGMFTSHQGDFSIQYYDPETRRIRHYYPDFFAEMADGSYQIIEVKGDDKIDDTIVKAKAEAATIMATQSGVEYKMYAGSTVMKSRLLDK
jgi:type III restriction enzyme